MAFEVTSCDLKVENSSVEGRQGMVSDAARSNVAASRDDIGASDDAIVLSEVKALMTLIR